MNPSADIIDILGGLDGVDKVVSDLVVSLDNIVRQSSNLDLRVKAVTTAMVMVAGAFQTSLVNYFMSHRDLFPALMKFVHDAPDSACQAYVLLGCLASYEKFEQQNVYQNRLEDFVDESTIRLLVDIVGESSRRIRDDYTAIQDDAAATLTLSSALTYVGLRSLSPDARKPAPPSEEEAKARFNELPSPLASHLLSTYTFVSANKIFASLLITAPSGPTTTETPFSSFLSSTSYLTHHAHRSPRASSHAVFCLLTLRFLLEEPSSAKSLCSTTPGAAIQVRLARQRAPFLPATPNARSPASVILDIAIDTLSHNLRRRLDVPLYAAALALILRILRTLAATSTRLTYHWSYLWGALFSLMRFTTTYATDLQGLRGLHADLATPLADTLAFALVRADAFLPTESDYDDLFYKLLETHELLPRFRAAFTTSSSSSSAAAPAGRAVKKDCFDRALEALVAVSDHYHSLLKGSAITGRKHQSANEVKKLIKDGYETLDLAGVAAGDAVNGAGAGAGAGHGSAAGTGFGHWEPWRESERKAEVKRLVRVAVEDARVLALR
jgi:hypothetical protein